MAIGSGGANALVIERHAPAHLVRRGISQHWLILISVALIISLAGGAYASVRPPSFTSSVEILLQPLEGNPFSPDALSTPQQLTVGLETEANLIADPDVAMRAAKILGPDVVTRPNSVSATVVVSSQILRISYANTTIAGAQQGARAFAAAYLASRQNRAETLRKRTIVSTQQDISSVQRQVDAASKAATGSNPPADAAARLQSLTNRLASLEDRLSTAQSMSTDPGSVVGPASKPSEVSRAMPYIIVVVAVLLGFGLGLAFAVLRAWADDRVDSDHDLFVAGIPVWAALGSAVAGQRRLSIESDDPKGRDSYRRLRAAVLSNVRRPATVVITSSTPHAVNAELSSNLAVSLADAGYKCALVDAEVEDPQVDVFFGILGRPGVADVLSGTASLDSAAIIHHGVTLVPAGSDPAAVLERYSGEAFRAMLRSLRERCDYLIVVSPDLSNAIGVSVTAAADCAVLVATDGVTTHEQVADVVDRSRTQHIRIGGVITVKPPVHKRARGHKDDQPSPVESEEFSEPAHAEQPSVIG